MRSSQRWSRILVPILGLLMVSQLVTGFSVDKMPEEAFEAVHVGGGILLLSLIIVHLGFNWGWVRQQYFKRSRRP